MTIHDLPTPALLVDLDALETNIARMAAHARASSKTLRPHAKAHKCVPVARRQVSAEAAGVCAATVPEAELMARAGIPSVLLTSPLADPRKMARIARLVAGVNEIAVVVDHAEQVRWYQEAASACAAALGVLVDLDVGDHRTGIAPGAPAVELAQAVVSAPNLRFAGLQAYSVRASHFESVEGRREYSARVLEAAAETRDVLARSGIETPVISGGSTGTWTVDGAGDTLTELQTGSYVFMDAAYRKIGGVDFANAMTVLATVVSANYPGHVTVDAGYKAFSTDRPFGPEPVDVTGVRYQWAGDEFGLLHLESPSRPLRLGARVRFVPPHCDPTVNLYRRIHVCRGEEVLDEWPVMD